MQSQLRRLRYYHPGFRVSPKASNWCPFMRKERIERRSSGGRNMKVEAEIGVMCQQVREHQGLPDTVRNQDRGME